MNKIYLLFTISTVNNSILFDTFNSYEEAENELNSNTDSNIYIVGSNNAQVYETFGTRVDSLSNYKPTIVKNLFPFYKIEYGTVVREHNIYDNGNADYFYTFRFIIEREIK